mgnify:CR=1 FL=1
MPVLALGSVQFGLDYGVANETGKTSASEVKGIMSLAHEFGIKVIDTAAMYGESETVIGEQSPPDSSFRYVTKTVALHGQKITPENLEVVRVGFDRSLQRLRQHSVYGLLIHHCRDLLAPGGRRLFDLIHGLKEDGKVEKIGVSAYDEEELQRILGKFPIDIVQIPINAFDQRLIQSGTTNRLKYLGVEIHARSIFLQGLMLMEAGALPPFFLPVDRHIEKYQDWLRSMDMTPLEGAVRFVQQQTDIDQVVVGVCDALQLEAVRSAFSKTENMTVIDYSRFAIDDETYVNPSNWPKS